MAAKMETLLSKAQETAAKKLMKSTLDQRLRDAIYYAAEKESARWIKNNKEVISKEVEKAFDKSLPSMIATAMKNMDLHVEAFTKD